MGLGSKSAFAIVSEFFIRTGDGTFTADYLVAKDALGVPTITLLNKSDEPTQGTSVKLFFGYSDYTKFKSALGHLGFFPNVYIELDNMPFDRPLVVGKNFLMSRVAPKELCVAYGPCYYPLDMTKFPTYGWLNNELRGRPSFGIKLDIGAVRPTAQRESLIYEANTVALIEKKLKSSLQEFVSVALAAIKSEQLNLENWLTTKNQDQHVYIHDNRFSYKFLQRLANEVNVVLPPMNEFEPLKGIDHSNINKNNVYYATYYSIYSHGTMLQQDYPDLVHLNNCVRVVGNEAINTSLFTDKLKIRYLISKGVKYIVRLEKPKLRNYITILNLRHVNKALWRSKIKQFQAFYMQFWNSVPRYSDVDVPEAFIEANKPKRAKTVIDKGSINYGYFTGSYTVIRNKAVKPFADFEKQHKGKLVVYSSHDDTAYMQLLHKFTKEVHFIQTAKTYHKLLEKNQKYVTLETFKETKAWQRIATAVLIQRLLHQERYLIDKCRDWIVKFLNQPLAKKLFTIQPSATGYIFSDLSGYVRDYVEPNQVNYADGEFGRILDVMVKDMLDTESQDMTIFPTYLKAIELLQFLQPLEAFKQSSYGGLDMTNDLVLGTVNEYFNFKLKQYAISNLKTRTENNPSDSGQPNDLPNQLDGRADSSNPENVD